MKRTLVLVIVAVAAIASVVIYVFSTKRLAPSPPGDPPHQQTGGSPRDLSGARDRATATARVPSAVEATAVRESRLPPPNARLVDTYGALRQMAQAGNPHAACRLGYELNRCRNLQITEAITKSYLARYEKAKQEGHERPGEEEMALARKREYENAERACAEFPPEETQNAWQYALEAAQTGNGPAIMNFVGLKMGLDQRNPANTAEGWLAFKQLGPGLLQDALNKGMPEAYEYAAGLYAWQNAPEQLLPFDPVRALAIYKALRTSATDDSYRDQMNTNIAMLTQRYRYSPEDLAKADVEAASYVSSLSQRPRTPAGVRGDPGAYCELD